MKVKLRGGMCYAGIDELEIVMAMKHDFDPRIGLPEYFAYRRIDALVWCKKDIHITGSNAEERCRSFLKGLVSLGLATIER